MNRPTSEIAPPPADPFTVLDHFVAAICMAFHFSVHTVIFLAFCWVYHVVANFLSSIGCHGLPTAF